MDLFLVFLEATVLYFAWTFLLPPPGVFLVIWALGWSMVFLAAIVLLLSVPCSTRAAGPEGQLTQPLAAHECP